MVDREIVIIANNSGGLYDFRNDLMKELIRRNNKIKALTPFDDKIEELKQKLADTDYIACKIAEGSATVEEYSEIIRERQMWREEINKLERREAPC